MSNVNMRILPNQSVTCLILGRVIAEDVRIQLSGVATMDSVSTQLESLMVLGIAMMEVMNKKVIILHIECLHTQLVWVCFEMVFTISVSIPAWILFFATTITTFTIVVSSFAMRCAANKVSSTYPLDHVAKLTYQDYFCSCRETIWSVLNV